MACPSLPVGWRSIVYPRWEAQVRFRGPNISFNNFSDSFLKAYIVSHNFVTRPRIQARSLVTSDYWEYPTVSAALNCGEHRFSHFRPDLERNGRPKGYIRSICHSLSPAHLRMGDCPIKPLSTKRPIRTEEGMNRRQPTSLS